MSELMLGLTPGLKSGLTHAGPPVTSVIEINSLSFFIHLGCSEEERTNLQEIRVSFRMTLLGQPMACTTDKLEDTICYGKVCTEIRSRIEGSTFQTIEKIAGLILDGIDCSIKETAKVHEVWVRVWKVDAPIEGLKGGSAFELSVKHTQ